LDLFAIILNYNSAKDTIELYRQLLSFNLSSVFIQIIDNASNKVDIKLLQNNIASDQLILNSKNLGYAGGNNIGISNAINNNADFILILNPDIRLNEDTIPIIINTIKKNGNIAAIGPRICYRDEPDKIYSDGGMLFPNKGYITGHKNTNKKINDVFNDQEDTRVDYINGSCMLINTTLLKKIGELNETFFLYFEETEWCRRAQKIGFQTLVNTNAVAFHSSSHKGSSYYFYMTRNRLLLAKLEKKYYTLTKNKIAKNLLKELLNKLTFKASKPYWFSRFKGLLYGIFNNIHS
jgi:GT2 family glycosyltransferase